MPAPQISTFSPRPAAPRQYSATASGERCAERTSSSQGMLRLASSSRQGCIRSRSDSEPISTPTSGCSGTFASLSLGRRQRDIGAVAHPFPADLLASRVSALARLGDRRAERAHVEDSASARQECLLAHRRAGLKDDRAGFLGRGYSGDRRALVGTGRVIAGGEHYRHAGLIRDSELQIIEIAVRGRGERLEQIALEPRQDRLSLGIAETNVEL